MKQEVQIIIDFEKWLERMEVKHQLASANISDEIRRYLNRVDRMIRKRRQITYRRSNTTARLSVQKTQRQVYPSILPCSKWQEADLQRPYLPRAKYTTRNPTVRNMRVQCYIIAAIYALAAIACTAIAIKYRSKQPLIFTLIFTIAAILFFLIA